MALFGVWIGLAHDTKAQIRHALMARRSPNYDAQTFARVHTHTHMCIENRRREPKRGTAVRAEFIARFVSRLAGFPRAQRLCALVDCCVPLNAIIRWRNYPGAVCSST